MAWLSDKLSVLNTRKMSFQGPVGFNGPQGFPGCTGPNGLQGTPYGPPGTTFYKGGVLPAYVYVDTVDQSIVINSLTAGTYYNVNTTQITLNASSPGNLYSGCFWSFKNNSGSILSVNYTPPSGNNPGYPSVGQSGEGAVYNGSLYAKIFTIAPGSGFTFVYSNDPVTSISYFIVI
jgi:hypothetical protein